MKIECLMIDTQVSFCSPSGELFVPGADQDVLRMVKMMERIRDRVDDYHVTLDTHHFYDVAHPIFWVDSKGNHPNPFTIISYEDVKNGVWKPSNPAETQKMLTYTETLAKNGRYKLCIWPPHCLIGSVGATVISPVAEQLLEWEKGVAMVDYVTKGSNYTTEHFGVLVADVPDSNDPSTQLNVRLIETLQRADVIGFYGEALSHCVLYSLIDICANFGEENIQKIHLVKDCCSIIPGFEDNTNKVLDSLVKRGLNLTTHDKFLK